MRCSSETRDLLGGRHSSNGSGVGSGHYTCYCEQRNNYTPAIAVVSDIGHIYLTMTWPPRDRIGSDRIKGARALSLRAESTPKSKSK